MAMTRHKSNGELTNNKHNNTMKAHKRLIQSMNGNAPKPANKRSKTWKAAHPVSAGVVPMTDYVPPSGSYQPAMRNTDGTRARFAVETLRALTA